MKRTSRITLLLAAFIISHVALSQATLVKDINTTPHQFRQSNDYSPLFCNCGNKLFFIGTNELGSELWVSDGTSAGTRMIKDINPGYPSGVYSTIQCHSSGKVIFNASAPSHGVELWSSDGTAEGTKIIKETVTGPSGVVTLLKVSGDLIYFVNYDNKGYPEIWKSDGTAANTAKIGNFGDLVRESYIFSLDVTTNHLYWGIYVSQGSQFGNQLWVTDLVGGTTEKVIDTHYDYVAQTLGDSLLFAADPDNDFNYSLYMTDGTVDGTDELSPLQYPYRNFIKYKDNVIFSNGSSTWISDGSAAGTVQLTSGYLDAYTIVGDYFYGYGYDFTTGNRIFKTDGVTTTNSISNLPGDAGDIKMSGNIPVLNDKMLFQFYSAEAGQELGITDATFSTVSLVKDINADEESSYPRAWQVYNGKGYFLADDGENGVSIWVTDGTDTGTSMVKDLSHGTSDSFTDERNALDVSDGKLHFMAANNDNIYAFKDLYITDGTEESTVVKKEFPRYGNTIAFGRAGENIIYYSQSGNRFYSARGNVDTVTTISNYNGVITGTSASIREYFSVGNKLLFHWYTSGVDSVNVGGEWWVSDGSTKGANVLKDINPGSATGPSGNGAVAGGKLFFNAADPVNGNELWVSDGTEEGTVLVKDINPGTANALQFTLAVTYAALGDRFIFLANTPETGKELWVSDGTAAGTSLIVDLVPGTDSLDVYNLTSTTEAVIFPRSADDGSWSLWKTDGTAGGTVKVTDLPDNPSLSGPGNFLGIGNKVFFSYDDGTHGNELWVSDGTSAGTLVIDIAEGASGSSPWMFNNIRGVAYFNCMGQLWRTNGTVIGTEKVNDYEGLEMQVNGDWVYFVCAHPQYGRELFKVPFTKRDQQITVSEVTDKTLGDESVVVEATATSGLPVTITAEEEITVKGDTLSFVKAGTVMITATQPGDSLFNAVAVSESICVKPVKPEIISSPADGKVTLSSSADAGNQWFMDDAAIASATAKTFVAEESGDYKVKVTVEGCSSEFSAVETLTITGIEELEKQISLYPNPAKETVRITSKNASPVGITVFDIHGCPAGSFALKNNEFVDHTITGYPKGLYMVKITSATGISYKKLVKE